MMGVAVEFFQVVFDCVAKFFSDGISVSNMDALVRKLFLLLGIVSTSVFLAWTTYHSSTLWNKKVVDIPAFRWLAGLSFALSLLFAVSFFSLRYLRETAIERTMQWKGDIIDNRDWGIKTFGKTYYKLRGQGEEDFADFPPPEVGGRKIPLKHESSRRITAQTYVSEAIEHFKASHPYLSLILKTALEVPEEKIYQDNASFFDKNPGQDYGLDNTVRIAADELKAGFDLRIPPLIKTTRMYLVIIFSLVMVAIYLAISVIAYRDIKTFR